MSDKLTATSWVRTAEDGAATCLPKCWPPICSVKAAAAQIAMSATTTTAQRRGCRFVDVSGWLVSIVFYCHVSSGVTVAGAWIGTRLDSVLYCSGLTLA